MNEITKDELRANGAGGSDLCDVAGAWLVCALVAAIALAVSGDLQPPPASAPIATALMRPQITAAAPAIRRMRNPGTQSNHPRFAEPHVVPVQ